MAATAAAMAEDKGWPKEIPNDRGTLLIYQPQIDRFKGNILEGRAAMSFTARGTEEPIFGAFWFKALLETDFDTRMARLVSIQVPGDVYRRNNDGAWQQRDRGGWSQPDQDLGSRPGSGGEGVSTRPGAGTGSGTGVSTRPSTGGYGRPTTLESDYQSRSRGSTRTSTYRGSMGGSRGYGGGGRRR